MVVTTGTMHVAMGQLIGRSLTHIGDLHVEMQRNAGQWVVAVEGEAGRQCRRRA